LRVWCSGFRVQGAGFRVQGAGFRVQGLGSWGGTAPTAGSGYASQSKSPSTITTDTCFTVEGLGLRA